jgi:hypothetical protein
MKRHVKYTFTYTSTLKSKKTARTPKAEQRMAEQWRTGQDTQRECRIHLLASVRKFSEDIPMSVTGSNRGIF